MLEGPLFTIKSRELSPDAENVFRISINPSHEVFNGHFEGKPVVPGVMILEIFKECALSCLEGVGNLRLRELSQARFTSLLEPSDDTVHIVRISLSKIDGSGAETRVKAEETAACGPVTDDEDRAEARTWSFTACMESDSAPDESQVYATAKGCLEESRPPGTCH